MQYMHLDDFEGAVSDEIGGGNGIQPMIVGAEMGKPILDADLMGRAYPNVSLVPYNVVVLMLTYSRCIKGDYESPSPVLVLIPFSLPGAYGIPGGLWPCAISDGIGNTIVGLVHYISTMCADAVQIMPKASNGHAVETILRTVTTEMGSRSGVSMAPLKRALCQEYGKLSQYAEN